jgi:hypothetical protein
MHDEVLPKLLIGIIAIILSVVFFRKSASADSEEKRREDLAALAKKLQLQFNPNSDFKLADRFFVFDLAKAWRCLLCMQRVSWPSFGIPGDHFRLYFFRREI